VGVPPAPLTVAVSVTDWPYVDVARLEVGVLVVVAVFAAGVTVSTNVAVATVLFASATVIVIVVDPDWPAAGVTVTVRFAPLPPNRMFVAGTSVAFDEAPTSVRLPAAVSMSPIVNAIWPVAVSCAVVRSAMVEIVGASLTDVTTIVTVAVFDSAAGVPESATL
jgi:hypothetical protein